MSTTGPTTTRCAPGRGFRCPAAACLAYLLGALALSFAPPPTYGQTEPAGARGWPVFRKADSGLPMGENRLTNPGFELGADDAAEGWYRYGEGMAIDATGGRDGGRALMLRNDTLGQGRGAYQVVTLNQTSRTPLYFSAWSRAAEVSGEANADYSVYLDLRYDDGSPLYAQTLRFEPGSHDWQFKEAFIVPTRPVASLTYYCLFRNTHTGTVWFDDLRLQEVDAELVTFDSLAAALTRPTQPPYGGPPVRLASADGLVVVLSTFGGAVTGVEVEGQAVNDPEYAFAGGFLVRDIATDGPVMHVGGQLEPLAGGAYRHSDNLNELDLQFSAVYRPLADRIQIDATLGATSPISRAVSLFFALPVAASGWRWDDDGRTSRLVAGSAEFANLLRWGVNAGATATVSRYPWASVAGAEAGLAMALPLDQPRLFRLACNPQTGQFYLVVDLGLSPWAGDPPGHATVSLILYRIDPQWGFRAAAQGYYDRYPEFFRRRIPPEREGIWVAFSDLSPIPDIEDFGIRIHELGNLRQVAFDDSQGILSFRYIAEPWSHWLPIQDTAVDPANYDQVLEYLRAERERGNRRAEATLSSGFWEDTGRYRYRSTVAPWCSGRAGCAVFTVNPDPDITDPVYPLNKAHLEWNDDSRATYQTMPGLDGEYIDSYLSEVFVLDFRAAHFAASDAPLAYRTRDRRLGVPQVFATTEFAQWLTDEVHDRLGRFTMANGMLWDVPWGANLFDFKGTEIDWLREGKLVFEPDSRLLYRRTLAYQRPYGFLMNTDFNQLTFEMVEQYFQACLFYGIYPSLFSQNASTDRYWDNPAWFERDRPLFRRYIPMIRELNRGGWQPVTHAWTTSSEVVVERFGAWPELSFTLRNLNATASLTATLTIDASALGLAGMPEVETLLGGGRLSLEAPSAETRRLELVLPPTTTEVLRLRGTAVYLPLAARQ